MSPSPQIAPPGSSTYSSNTLQVGDGTWDSEKNTFLLPNLVGLNFETMRYNGMANRFFTLTGYHSLIKAHGILGAITFLGLVPAAIMLARFYRKSPYWALRLHIWLQILVFILTTVLFILGFFAVGPERNLSNPHHGIGLALYVLIIVQVLGGWLVHRKTKGKRAIHIPLKLVLHHWFGRMIALLGITQIPLGLTLYGSPRELFILYAIAVFALLLTYFILSLLHQRRLNHDYDTGGSYVSGPDDMIDEQKHERKNRFAKLAAGGLGAAGIAALLKRRSSKNRRENEHVARTESGASYLSDEKYSDTSQKGWTSKLLTIGTVAGGIAAVKALFGRKQDDSSDAGPYRPPLGGNTSVTSDSYLEEGRPPRPTTPTGASPGYARPSHPLAQPPMTPPHRRSNSSLTYSYASGSPSRQDRRHNFRDAAATGGALFALRQMFKSRRQRKEGRRFEEDRLHRTSPDPYTGEGFSPRPQRSHRMHGHSSTDVSSSIADAHPNRRRPSARHHGPPLGGVGAASAAALADRDRLRPAGTDPTVTAGPSTLPGPENPPLPPTHRTDVDSSGSEIYSNASGHPHNRHRLRDDDGRGGGSDTPVDGASSSRRRRRSSRTQNTDSLESPPVSLKVKMHNDGRHVTLRRLTEEEAANQRRGSRRAGDRASVPPAAASAGAALGAVPSGAGVANSGRRRRRNSSFSSSSGGEGLSNGGAAGGGGRRLSSAADRRWRRTEALERQQAQQSMTPGPPLPPPPPMTAGAHPPTASYPYPYQQQQQHPAPPPPPPTSTTTAQIDPRTGQHLNIPPPPPIPASSGAASGFGSITSPGTETSGATEYANNRRRRRAERAQARLAREGRMGGGGGGGGGVEFT